MPSKARLVRFVSKRYITSVRYKKYLVFEGGGPVLRTDKLDEKKTVPGGF